MTSLTNSRTLDSLFAILSEERKPQLGHSSGSRFETELLAHGVTHLSDIRDYVSHGERRHYGLVEQIVDDLLEPLAIPQQFIYRRPTHLSDDVSGFPGLDALSTTGLLIALQELGLQVDPSRMVAAMNSQIGDRELLTGIEFDICYYEHWKGRRRTSLRVDAVGLDGEPRERTIKDQLGYRITMRWRGDTAVELEVCGPKYRKPKPQELVKCEYCGMKYVTNNSSDARQHRATHLRAKKLFDPLPDGRLQKRVKQGLRGEVVDAVAPLWMHGAVYERAVAFKREFKYDFVQWEGSKDRRAPSAWSGHLFAGADGTTAGACGFYRQPSGPLAGQWALHWVWIAPKYRRLGLLEARWNDFSSRYGDFHIEQPISPEMQRFILKHGTAYQKSLVDVELTTV